MKLTKTHGRSKLTSTGALVKPARKKRKFELARPPIETQLGEEKKKKIRTRGGSKKTKLLTGNKVNVVDKDGNISSVEIKGVETNKCSVDYARRSIITKGAILNTELGFVKVTSRPGQDGVINGVVVDYKKGK